MKIFDRSDVLSAQAVPQIERITTATAIYVIESGADYAALPAMRSSRLLPARQQHPQQ